MAENVFTFRDSHVIKKKQDICRYPSNLREEKVPVVIDNGSNFCKAGWASDTSPTLVFRNLLAKQRSKKDTDNLIGNNIPNLEAVRWLIRTQFDKDIVTHFDIQEQVFDHIFQHLGIETNGSVDHPVVLTETVCNPNYCRNLMTELLFECYHVPSVAYGVDSLFSLFKNRTDQCKDPIDGIVVALGHHHSYILPYLHQRLDATNLRRINVGGFKQTAYLHRLLQLKYPVHANSINLSRAEELIIDHSYVAQDFFTELGRWGDVEFYKSNVHKMQLPYTPLHGWTDDSLYQNYSKLDALVEAVLAQFQDVKELSITYKLKGDFDEETRKDFKMLMELIAKWQSLSAQCMELLGEGSKLLKNQANSELLHEWTDRVRIAHHFLCENRSDWLNKKEGLRERCVGNQAEDGDEKEEMQDLETEGFLETDMYKQALIAVEKLEQESRPDEGEIKKIESLEHLLRDVEATLNCHSNQQRMTFDLAEYHQIHMGTERIRVPEILFQPSIIGLEQGGITETLEFVLKKYNEETQQKLVQNIFVTGGNAKCPNMVSRIEAELRAIRPFNSSFQVYAAADPVLDAWRGAAKWSMNPLRLSKGSTTQEEYLEKGVEYLKEHDASNRYMATPLVKR